MAISSRLREFLDKEGIDYKHMEHARAYTASETAGAQHVPGEQLIKAVVVKSNGNYMMCVLSAIHMIDFDKLKKTVGNKDITLAAEDEVRPLFPDEETGAEPPFGNLYNIPTFVDKAIESNSDVVFNAGTHTDTVKMKASDYLRLVTPTIGEFGKHI